MRNGPEQVRTCLWRRGGRGPEGWLLSGSAAVEGSLPRRLPRGHPAWRWGEGGGRESKRQKEGRRKIDRRKGGGEGVGRGPCSWDRSHWRRLTPGGTSVTPKGYPVMAGPPGAPSPGLSPKTLVVLSDPFDHILLTVLRWACI